MGGRIFVESASYDEDLRTSIQLDTISQSLDVSSRDVILL